jgi:hypothetical protein
VQVRVGEASTTKAIRVVSYAKRTVDPEEILRGRLEGAWHHDDDGEKEPLGCWCGAALHLWARRLNCLISERTFRRWVSLSSRESLGVHSNSADTPQNEEALVAAAAASEDEAVVVVVVCGP